MTDPAPLNGSTAKVGMRVWSPKGKGSQERIVGTLVLVEPSRMVILADGPDTLPLQARRFERWSLPVYRLLEES